MIFESNDIIIGFDLNREDSQITFYNRTNADPMTVSIVPGEEKYLNNFFVRQMRTVGGSMRWTV